MNEQWIGIIDDFESHYPDLAKDVVDWYPVGQMEIAIKLKDNIGLTYNILNNVVQYHCEANQHEVVMDELLWRNKFAERLIKKMRILTINQQALSEITGISVVTINKYVRGKVTPSGYNIDKIAAAMHCSASELMNIR